jgi:hypothetical protein
MSTVIFQASFGVSNIIIPQEGPKMRSMFSALQRGRCADDQH